MWLLNIWPERSIYFLLLFTQVDFIFEATFYFLKSGILGKYFYFLESNSHPGLLWTTLAPFSITFSDLQGHSHICNVYSVVK